MNIIKKLMVIPLAVLFLAAPYTHDAKAAVFISAGVAPVYYPAPAYYAPPPVAYAPPAYVAPAPAVVYAAPAVVSPVVFGVGGYGYRHWRGYRHYWH